MITLQKRLQLVRQLRRFGYTVSDETEDRLLLGHITEMIDLLLDEVGK